MRAKPPSKQPRRLADITRMWQLQREQGIDETGLRRTQNSWPTAGSTILRAPTDYASASRGLHSGLATRANFRRASGRERVNAVQFTKLARGSQDGIAGARTVLNAGHQEAVEDRSMISGGDEGGMGKEQARVSSMQRTETNSGGQVY